MKNVFRKTAAAAVILSQTIVPTFADSYLYRHLTSGETIVVQAPDEITIPGKVVNIEPETPIDTSGEPYVQLPSNVDPLTAGLRFDAEFELRNANGLAMYGNVPPGLFVNAVSKTISGVPTKGGTYTFNLRAFLTVPGQEIKTYDSNSLTITVLPVLNVANSGALEGFVGDAVSGTIRTEGAAGNVAFEFETPEEERPTWLNIDQTGHLSGAVLGTGSWSVAVRATDEEGRTGVTSFPVNAVNEAIITVADAYGATIGQGSGFSPELSTGSWEGFLISQGNLPPGMTINPNTGRISGTPTVEGSFPIRITGNLLGREAESEETSINVRQPVAVAVSALPKGYQNDDYNTDHAAQASASGGQSPYTFSMSGGVPGLTLDPSTGIFGGVPTGATTEKPVSVNVTVTDAEGRKDTSETTIFVTPEIAMTQTPVLAQRPMVGRSLLTEERGEAKYGNPGYTWTIDNGPAWLSMNGTSFSGTPVTAGSNTFDVVVTDATGHSKTSPQSFTVDEELVVTDPAFGQTQIGEALNVTEQPTISGGVQPYSVSLQGAPSWMTVNSAGELGGVSTTSGNLSFNIVVEDAHERITTLPVAFNLASGLFVKEPVFSNTMTGEAFAFERQPQGSGGFQPYAWEIGNFGSEGNPGLSIDPATGELSGTANEPGFYSFDITMTDSRGSVAERTVEVAVADNISVTAPEFALSMAGGDLNVVSNPVRTGGTAPFSWSKTQGPDWLKVNSASGALSGVPSSSGEFDVSLIVTDAQGHSATTSASLEVSPGIILTPPSVAATKTGEILIVNAQASASGGNGDFSWTMSGAPSWMTINSVNGSIDGVAGTPDTTENVKIKVTDARGLTRETTFNVIVFDDLTLSAPVFNTAEQGVRLSLVQAKATYGVKPYEWSLHGDIPAWLTFSEETGNLAGIPTYKGAYDMTIEVSDALGDSRSADFTLSVDPVITMTAPEFAPVAPFGKISMIEQATAAGGYGKKRFTMSDAPAGLKIDVNKGWISGTAPDSGSYNFDITATDDNGDATTITANLTVADDLIALSPSFGLTYFGDALNVTKHLDHVGGYDPATWALVSGPEWLKVSASGQISGTPDSVGLTQVETRITDALGSEATTEFYVEALGELTARAPTFDYGFKGGPVPINTQPSANGGVPPYKWELLSADETLSIGINSVTGELTIAETTDEGDFPVSLGVSDADDNYAEVSFNVPVLPVLSLVAPTVSMSVIDDEIIVAKQTRALGGRNPLVWSISGEPDWINFNETTGAISGVATETGSFSFDITAVDANNITASVEANVVVTNPVGASVENIPDGEVGLPIKAYAAQTDFGVAPYNWQVTSGPTWLNVNSAGTLSGTPDAEVDGSFTVTAIDALGYTASASGSVKVTTPLTMTPLVMANRGMIGLTIEVETQPQASGGDGNYTWSMSGAPDGVVIDSGTGVISGTPAEAGNFTVAVTVQDGDGRETSQTTALPVDETILIAVAPTLNAIQTKGDPIATPDSLTAISTGGFGSKTWSVEYHEGDVNLGAIFSSSGSLSGRTWADYGTSSFDLVVTDEYGRVARRTYSDVTVDDALVIAWDTDIAPVRQGDEVNFEVQPTAIGGSAPYIWAFDDSHQTTYIQMANANSVTPTLSGTAWNSVWAHNAVLKVTDADGREATVSKPIEVIDRLTLAGFDYAPATQGAPFQTTALPTAANGTSPYVWTAQGLPAGLTINSATGQISGSPTSSGTFEVKLKATSTEGYTGYLTATLEIAEVLTITNVQNDVAAYEGHEIAFVSANTATGGTGNYVWGLKDDPTGFTINPSTGELTGIAPEAGSHTIYITVTDDEGRYAERANTIVVYDDLEIASGELLPLTVGLSSNGTQSPFSGNGTRTSSEYEWVFTTSVPEWITINGTTGTLSLNGYPTESGTFPLHVRYRDKRIPSMYAEVTIDLVVRDRLIATAAKVGLNHTPGEAFSAIQEAVITGGSGNYTFALSGASGASGIDITSNGIITGTVTSTSGIYNETFIVQDDEGRSASFTIYNIAVGLDLTYAEDATNNGQAEYVDGNTGSFYLYTSRGHKLNSGPDNGWWVWMDYEYDQMVVADTVRYEAILYKSSAGSGPTWKLQVSEDGTNWTTLGNASHNNSTKYTSYRVSGSLKFNSRQFKYVRMITNHAHEYRTVYMSLGGHRLYEYSFSNSNYE